MSFIPRRERDDLIVNMVVKRILVHVFIMVVGVLAFAHLSLAAVSMPSFTLPKALDGNLVESSVYKGHAMLVTFFATWCPPCRQEIPVLKSIQEKYNQQKFTVIALSLDKKGPEIVTELIKIEKINYPVLMADKITAKKFDEVVMLPTSFLINKKGNVVKTYRGYISQSVLEKDIGTVL